MSKTKGIILGIAVYIFGGSIVGNILSSVIDFYDMTFREAYLWNMYIFIAMAAIYCLVYEFIVDVQNLFSSILALVVMAFLVYYLPYSIGMAVLFNIVNIGAIIWSVCSCNKSKVTVEYTQNRPPQIIDFFVSEEEVSIGDSIRVCWETNYAKTISLKVVRGYKYGDINVNNLSESGSRGFQVLSFDDELTITLILKSFSGNEEDTVYKEKKVKRKVIQNLAVSQNINDNDIEEIYYQPTTYQSINDKYREKVNRGTD